MKSSKCSYPKKSGAILKDGKDLVVAQLAIDMKKFDLRFSDFINLAKSADTKKSNRQPRRIVNGNDALIRMDLTKLCNG
jgi:hypothetical protein